MTIFVQVVLPVIFVFALGFLVQKWKKVDIKPISTVAIYVMSPCLIFRTFYTSELNLQYLYIAIYSLSLLFALIAINKLFAKIAKLPQTTESGLILSTAFMNSGNYGAPIILFAYGQIGFNYAVTIMVIQAILMNVFGVYYAAREQSGMRTAMRSVLLMPATYSVIAGLLLNAVQVEIPKNVLLTVDIIAEAAVPTVMIILGMQLALIRFDNFDWGKISYGVIVRLIISPLIAFLITQIIPFDPLLANVLIVCAAMPSAATIVMYAVQFNSEPRLVSSITLITTLGSILTITWLLVLLG